MGDSMPGVMGSKEEDQRSRKHIFVCNGSSEFLEMAREIFEMELYNVTTTNYVPKTFDQIVALEPDLIVLDLALRVQSGWDLMEHLHAEARTLGIPVIVFSTDPKHLEAVQADPDRYGGQRFIGKPFAIEDMLTAVDDLIGTA